MAGPAPNVGDLIGGKYRIERRLGEGGMAIVYAATHLALGRQVALKFVRPWALGEREARERFKREAQAMFSLRSEYAVRMLDLGELPDGDLFLVMEMLEGKTLADLIAERGFVSEREAATYVGQACEALAEAHALGIVHRDLKPANLFLTTNAAGTPCVKVLDFGLAKLESSLGPGSMAPLTNVATTLGTPKYMAPEQWERAAKVDGRADIFSLGVILFQLLTGKVPHEDLHLDDRVRMILAGAVPSPKSLRPEVSDAMARSVMRCLRPLPDERFPSAQDLAGALSHVLQPVPSAAARAALNATGITAVVPDAVRQAVLRREADVKQGLASNAAVSVSPAQLAALQGVSSSPPQTSPMPGAPMPPPGARDFAQTKTLVTGPDHRLTAPSPVVPFGSPTLRDDHPRFDEAAEAVRTEKMSQDAQRMAFSDPPRDPHAQTLLSGPPPELAALIAQTQRADAQAMQPTGHRSTPPAVAPMHSPSVHREPQPGSGMHARPTPSAAPPSGLHGGLPPYASAPPGPSFPVSGPASHVGRKPTNAGLLVGVVFVFLAGLGSVAAVAFIWLRPGASADTVAPAAAAASVDAATLAPAVESPSPSPSMATATVATGAAAPIVAARAAPKKKAPVAAAVPSTVVAAPAASPLQVALAPSVSAPRPLGSAPKPTPSAPKAELK